MAEGVNERLITVEPRTGEFSGTSVRTLLKVPFTLLLPMALVRLYRTIPAEARASLFPGPSTSHLALERMRRGENGWRAIREHAKFVW